MLLTFDTYTHRSSSRSAAPRRMRCLCSQEVAAAKESEFITSLSRPPLLKYHPAAPFLGHYAIDALGMSCTENPDYKPFAGGKVKDDAADLNGRFGEAK